jgi:HAD superfamily hydrolase (TIGR01509 family)
VGAVERLYQGVVFDLDGVLADSEGIHVEAWKLTLEQLKVPWEEVPLQEWVGIPDVEIVGQAVEEYRIPLSPADLLERKRSVFRSLIPRQLRPFAGVREELGTLDAMPLGLATASPRRETELMLGVMGLRALFSVTVTGDDVQHPKPHPETYLTAAARLGVAPRHCLAVEDSPVGLAAALAAGLTAVAVTNTFPLGELTGAHRVFASTVEAVRWIRRVGGQSAGHSE